MGQQIHMDSSTVPWYSGIPLDFCYIQQIWSSLAYLKLCFIQIEHNRLKLLQHPLVNNFLFQKFWVMAFPLLLISLLFYLVFLVTFNVFTLLVPRPGPDSETCKISETLYSAVYQYLCPLNQLAHFTFLYCRLGNFLFSLAYSATKSSKFKTKISKSMVLRLEQLQLFDYNFVC